MVTFEDVKNNAAVKTYIEAADESLVALGYTEHSYMHVGRVAHDAAKILTELDFDSHTVELAKIAGYIHDIGNLVNRIEQPLSQPSAITTRARECL